MSEISDDEFTLLEIMSHGEAMMAIGRWEKPLKSLAAKGMANPQDGFNYILTTKGREALGGHKEVVDTAWAKAAIAAHNQNIVAKTATQPVVEGGWQPIETAPREVVLLYDLEEGICCGQISRHDNWMPHPASYESEVLHPTHWMKLPDPPK